jgi:hypothetical protein
MIHGIFYLITKPFSSKNNSEELSLRQWPSMLSTFLLVCAAFVFFRAENLTQALGFFSRIIHLSDGSNLFQLFEPEKIFAAIFFSSTLFVAEWIQRKKKHAMDIADATPFIRHSVYYVLIFVILFAFQTDRIFIYFQF